MKISLLFVLLFGLVVHAGTAHADWDRKGWEKLGEREVNRRVDRDRIAVGRHEGTFTKLTLLVEGSDLELLDMTVTFANGQKFSPRVKHNFREGARTRVIDLPGNERSIQSIDLVYKNTRGGGNARVEVWGWKSGNGGRGPDRDHGRRR